MKCLTYRHLFGSLTLTLLFLFPNSTWSTEDGIPSELTIKIGNTKVKGFLGDPARVKESAENQEELPPEGFVYRVERGPDPSINIAVWSISKREAEILSAAEEKLSELVYEKQTAAGSSPGGFLYSSRETGRYGKDVAAVPAKRQIAKKAAPSINDLKPVMATVAKETPFSGELRPTLASGAKAEPGETMADTANSWGFNKAIYWLILAAVFLIGVVWGRSRRAQDDDDF